MDVANVIVVAGPYLLLALLGVKKLVPWAVALALTLSLWSYSLLRTINYRWEPDGSGVDMGTAFLILTSWLWITLAAFPADAVQQYVSSRR